MLPEEGLDLYFAWQMSGKDTLKFFEILETRDIYEVYLAYAMKRVDIYVEYVNPK
jgi:hypothetical protein